MASKANIFIERSMRGALDFFKEAVFSEESARRSGFLQRTDPRLKLIALFAILISICFVRSLAALSVIYALSVLLAAASKVRIIYFIKRVWFFIPIFTVFIVLPAVFIYGLYPAAVFVMRVASCVSFSVLVAITTLHSPLLKALRGIGIPDMFVQILDMMYRYLFLFVKVFEDMHTALKSRLVRRLRSAQARHWVASRISFLFRRSLKMSEEVYLAMRARGYTGEWR